MMKRLSATYVFCNIINYTTASNVLWVVSSSILAQVSVRDQYPFGREVPPPVSAVV